MSPSLCFLPNIIYYNNYTGCDRPIVSPTTSGDRGFENKNLYAKMSKLLQFF